MKLRLIASFAALLFLTACGPSRYTSSTTNLSSISEFAFVQPYSYIVLYGDDGKGLIPDFILHFPNNRHVVVDSKMSLTDYERYMNAEDGTPEKSAFLKAHINSTVSVSRSLSVKCWTIADYAMVL